MFQNSVHLLISLYLALFFIAGNLTGTISDHLPQLLIVPNIFSNPPSNKSNIYEKDWSNFDQEDFILDFFPSIGMKH